MENKALGFIEITGVVAAIDALDIMTKSANVELVTWERKLGGRLVTMIVRGDVSAVTAAVENVCKGCIKKPAAHLILASPHSETNRIVALSAKRIQKQNKGKENEENAEGKQSVHF